MGEALAILTAVVWASANISIRYGVVQEYSGVVLDVRFIMAVWGIGGMLIIYIILPIFGIDVLEGLKSLNFRTILLFSVDGLLTKVLSLFLLAVAFGQIGAARAAAIRASDSVITCVLSYVLLGESISLIQVGATILVTVGVVLASLKSEVEVINSKATSDIRIKGSIIALLAGATSSLGNISRGAAIHSGGSFLSGVLINYFIGFLIYGLIYACLPKLRLSLKEMGRTSFRHYSFAGIMDVVGTLTFFASFTFAPVWLAVTLKSTQPLLVLGLSALFLKKFEQINVRVILSSLLVVIGACVIVST